MGVRTTSYHRSNGHSYRRSPSPDKKSYHRRHHHHRRHDYSSRFVCFLLELLNSYKIKYLQVNKIMNLKVFKYKIFLN